MRSLTSVSVSLGALHFSTFLGAREGFFVDFCFFPERLIFDDEIFDEEPADFFGREPKAARRTATASSPTRPRSSARVFDDGSRLLIALWTIHIQMTRPSRVCHISSKAHVRAQGNYGR